MKLRSFLVSFLAFLILGIILLIIKQNIAGVISLGFASMLGISFVTFRVMEKNKIKKLDSLYYVLKKEALIKQYEKLAKEFDSGKLRAVTLMHLKFKDEYSPQELKNFGLWLTNNYSADPSGFDGGIIILFVNIHELMIKELMKHIKNQLKEENINVDFDYGYANYVTNDEYEELKQKALETIKTK